MSLVSFTNISRRNTDAIKQAIRRSLDLIDFSFDKRIDNLVIKPNLCYYWDYSTGQTTDPAFVALLVDLIREEISPRRISIVESDASAMKCMHAFKMLGYERLMEDRHVELVNLSQDRCHPVDVDVADQTFHLLVPETIQTADLKINVTKIKYTMEEIKITCALKNIFGCNPYPKKFKYHPQLGKTIVACNKAMRFDLCIVDGNIVSGMLPRKMGLVMASVDPVATDTAVAKMAGVNPRSINYLRLAEREGLGKMSFVAKGVSPSYFAERFPRKNVTKKLMGKAYNLATRLGLASRLGL